MSKKSKNAYVDWKTITEISEQLMSYSWNSSYKLQHVAS